ncbi:hypothetical protein JNUCC0626_19815 [Lentzea sp. JNUCC 0626]|uniref:DUF7574 domain-containing protein n=1 Tax=Lentzea sp. JNUCC 0626 TaxID=3367513 RepID=UPI0037499927
MKSNILRTPDRYGLRLLAAHDASEEACRFDMVAVWQDEEDNYLVGHSEHCVCDQPFEGMAVMNLAAVEDLDAVAVFARESWAEWSSDFVSEQELDAAVAELVRQAVEAEREYERWHRS